MLRLDVDRDHKEQAMNLLIESGVVVRDIKDPESFLVDQIVKTEEILSANEIGYSWVSEDE